MESSMDRFQDSAKKGFDFLKSRAQETVAVQKLNSNIRELEDRRDQCLLDLGHRVLAMFDQPEFDKEALRDRVMEVQRLNSELEGATAEYQSVKTQLKSSVEEILPTTGRGSRSGPEPPEYEATS